MSFFRRLGAHDAKLVTALGHKERIVFGSRSHQALDDAPPWLNQENIADEIGGNRALYVNDRVGDADGDAISACAMVASPGAQTSPATLITVPCSIPLISARSVRAIIDVPH